MALDGKELLSGPQLIQRLRHPGTPEGDDLVVLTGTEAVVLADAIERRDTILRRLLAPCPQCKTLGDDPNCTATIHVLPKEAKDDMRAVLYP